MTKYRVVRVPAGYVVERKGWFGWGYIDPEAGPKIYETQREAEDAARYYLNPPPPDVVSEFSGE